MAKKKSSGWLEIIVLILLIIAIYYLSRGATTISPADGIQALIGVN